MPSDLDLTTSQFDKDGFPIAIGLQPPQDHQVGGDSTYVAPEELGPEGLKLTNVDDVVEPLEASSGYEMVADMMRQQDEVLEQLDDLNARIELAIKQISAARKSEIEALEAQGQWLNDDDQMSDQQKAA